MTIQRRKENSVNRGIIALQCREGVGGWNSGTFHVCCQIRAPEIGGRTTTRQELATTDVGPSQTERPSATEISTPAHFLESTQGWFVSYRSCDMWVMFVQVMWYVGLVCAGHVICGSCCAGHVICGSCLCRACDMWVMFVQVMWYVGHVCVI